MKHRSIKNHLTQSARLDDYVVNVSAMNYEVTIHIHQIAARSVR